MQATLLATLFSLLLCCASAAQGTADARSFLSPAFSVPPNASTATGTASISVNPQDGALTYDISVSGLSGTVTAAHVHVAAAGSNGPIVFPLTSTGPTSWQGGLTINPAQLRDYYMGLWYVNVHTTSFPGGELRGQLHVPRHWSTKDLDGDHLPPPINTAAVGLVRLQYDDANRMMISSGTFGGFNSTQAHLHNNTSTDPGPILINYSIGAGTLTGNSSPNLLVSHISSWFTGDGDVYVHSAANFLPPEMDDPISPGDLNTDTDSLSVTNGGFQTFLLDAGVGRAGDFYLLLGSLSGTSPGLPIAGADVLPLNLDGYFGFTLASPNTGPLVNTFGLLDATGHAEARLNINPGVLGALAGASVHHAYVAFDLSLVVSRVSNPVQLDFLP